MNNKLTNKEFIQKCIDSHPTIKYDYSCTKYKGYRKKITVICPIHGKFEQVASTHIRGGNCPICSRQEALNKVSSNTNEFIKRAQQIHENKYDYSKVEYKNRATKVLIKCNCCGKEFWQLPGNHLKGNGCPNRCYKNTTEQFINKAKNVHGNNYNYDKVEYINSTTPVIITCPIHGDFKQRPSNHLQGSGCKECAKLKQGPNKITQEEFLNSARQVHGSKYNYSKVRYTGINNKIIIICPKHGEFLQSPCVHLRGSGCPKCRSSRGENIVRGILEKHNIKFEENTYIGYKGRYMRPDFVLNINKNKYIIEYNGEQHYRPVEKFGGKETYEEQVVRDNLLKEYCSLNKIQLIEIKYNMKFSEIEQFLIIKLNLNE